ncbi:MAG: hypothetical protein ACJ8GJ_09440 [Vitreoscilla sp.]
MTYSTLHGAMTGGEAIRCAACRPTIKSRCSRTFSRQEGATHAAAHRRHHVQEGIKMSKTSVAAPSTLIGLPVMTMALALVVALELGGGYALSQGPGAAEPVASADGATLYAAAQPRAARVASVEISIVAQADAPAR